MSTQPLLAFTRTEHVDGHTSLECQARERITIEPGETLRLVHIHESGTGVAAVVVIANPLRHHAAAPRAIYLPDPTQETS